MGKHQVHPQGSDCPGVVRGIAAVAARHQVVAAIAAQEIVAAAADEGVLAVAAVDRIVAGDDAEPPIQ